MSSSLGTTNLEDKLISLLKKTAGQPGDDAVNRDPLLDVSLHPRLESKKLYINNLPSLLTGVSKYLKIEKKKYNRFRKLLGLVNIDILSFISNTSILQNSTTLSRLTRQDDTDRLELTRILNKIKHRFKRRLKVSKYNPEFALFLVKPLCKS